jgi:hypothetical protein
MDSMGDIGSGITVKLSGKRSPPTQHRNIPILSAPMMGYTPIASQLFIFAISDPLSELEQETDAPRLPNLELVSFAIADPLSRLANLVDSSCLLICDRTQIILMDSMGDIGFGITAELTRRQ